MRNLIPVSIHIGNSVTIERIIYRMYLTSSDPVGIEFAAPDVAIWWLEEE